MRKKFFYRDVYKKKFHLVFVNVRHRKNRENETGLYLIDEEFSRIQKILIVVKKLQKEDLQILYKEYLKLFTIPHEGLKYFIVPKNYHAYRFEEALRKFELVTRKKGNNEISLDKSNKNTMVAKKANQAIQKNQTKQVDYTNLSAPNFEPAPTPIEKELLEFSSGEVPGHKEAVSNKVYTLSTGNKNPTKRKQYITQINRKQNIVSQLKKLYDNTCQVCKEKLDIGNDEYYSEVHHIQPLGKHNGPDIPENMIVLCPNHHKMFDNGAITVDLKLQKLIHVNEKQLINGNALILKHEIDIRYINYHNLNIFKVNSN